MAQLSTPYHPCSTIIVNKDGVPVQRCPRCAYRKDPMGKWRCKTCTTTIKARLAKGLPVR